MSIIGTRPPLISETNLYELHHRARLAIKPGITGMWQVSGRSDITDFEEVVVRIFGIGDNPKENKLFGKDLDELEQKLGVRLWENSAHSLWEANLYAEADNIQDGVDAALNLYRIVNDEPAADIEQWRNAEKKSLCSGFNAADPDAIIAWNRRMEDLVAMDEITKLH